MTLWGFFRVLLRQWPIVVVGTLVTVMAMLAVASAKGVYYSRTEVVLLAPTSPAYPNALRTQSEDIIILAGVIARRMTGAGELAKFASPDVTLVGQGVRDGWSVRLPDTGGQWGTNFASQRLILEIVAPEREAAQADQRRLIARVTGELDAMQRAQRVDPVNVVTAIVAPETTIIQRVGGSRPRALAATALLGAFATAAAAAGWNGRRRRTAVPASGSREHRVVPG